jgi:DNA-binding transcriptional regulator WhiA
MFVDRIAAGRCELSKSVSKDRAAEYRIYAAFLARGNVRAAGQSGRFHLEEATIADLHRAFAPSKLPRYNCCHYTSSVSSL